MAISAADFQHGDLPLILELLVNDGAGLSQPLFVLSLHEAMTLSTLTDHESELYRGGYRPISINISNRVKVDPVSTAVAVNTRIITASQFNNAVSISAFGGVNSSFQAELITQQVNELYFA